MDKGSLQQEIDYLCQMKKNEFFMLGYEEASSEEIWECVSKKYKELPPLHKLANDILSLKPGEWMNWVTVEAYRGNFFTQED